MLGYKSYRMIMVSFYSFKFKQLFHKKSYMFKHTTISILTIIISLYSEANAQSYKQIDLITHECGYLYEYQSDSLNSDNRRHENMCLLIGKKHSQFSHSSQYKKDSLLNSYMNHDISIALSNMQQLMKNNRPSFFTNYYIIKNYSSTKINLFEHITPGYYNLSENLTFNWELIPKSDTTILNLKCKKATMNYFGRNYNAWYTPEIPIQDGPYKFKNLPGLIVKIEDSKQEHTFTLEYIKNIEYTKPLLQLSKKYQIINGVQYQKAKKVKQKELMQMIQNMELGQGKNVLEIESRSKSKNNFIEKY